MAEQFNHNPNMVTRRKPVKLPSIWAHLFWAITTLIFITLSHWVFVKNFGQAEDGVARGWARINPVPMPPESDTLAGDTDALPDLLAGIVPEGVNPTEDFAGQTPASDPNVDALGNPTNPQNVVSGGRTIRINGQNITPAALPPAPISGLSRPSNFGDVPAPNASGLTPRKAYARPFTKVAGTQNIAIIIGGLGLNRTLTQEAVNTLPPDVTLSFAAHAPNLQTQINQAREKGHEVLLEIPMESEGFNASEPGAARALRATTESGDNLRNLDFLLSRAQGYFGVINYNGDQFLTRTDTVIPVATHLKAAGLGFIFDGSLSAPSLPIIARNADLPFAKAYNLLDNPPEPAIIKTELTRLKARASSGTTPIAVGFAFPETLSAVRTFATSLDNEAYTLAPASSVLP